MSCQLIFLEFFPFLEFLAERYERLFFDAFLPPSLRSLRMSGAGYQCCPVTPDNLDDLSIHKLKLKFRDIVPKRLVLAFLRKTLICSLGQNAAVPRGTEKNTDRGPGPAKLPEGHRVCLLSLPDSSLLLAHEHRRRRQPLANHVDGVAAAAPIPVKESDFLIGCVIFTKLPVCK